MTTRSLRSQAHHKVSAQFGVAIVLLIAAGSAAYAEVSSCSGVPVEGEVVGVVEEISADESGLSMVFVASDNEELGLLTVTNGDPAQGANDLDQYGDLFKTALSFDSEVVLSVANGQVFEAILSKREGNVPCCKAGLCSKKKRATCTGDGGKVYSTDTACKKHCE